MTAALARIGERDEDLAREAGHVYNTLTWDEGPGQIRRAGVQDWLWNNYFDVVIGPHPALTASQKNVVAKDYGLDQGNGVLSVRYAMLFYVLKRLGLLGDAAKQSAHTQHIVTINRKETEAALEKAEFQL